MKATKQDGPNCNICNKQFSSAKHLKRHFTYKHNQSTDRFYCGLCQTSYKSNETLRVHMKIHSASLRLICEFCEKCFIRRPLLEKHIKNVHECTNEESNLKCKFCDDLSFSGKGKLEIHVKKYHERVRYSCDFCGNKYMDRSSLKNHITLKHSTEQKNMFQCDECSKSYTSKNSLQIHKRNVHRNINFKCNICSKDFNNKGSLNYHMKLVHADPKEYPCNVCGKSFKALQILRKHIIVHNDDKFECNECGKILSRKHLLKSHKIKFHTTLENEAAFKCGVEECSKPFKTNLQLKYHMIDVHRKGNFQCTMCKKVTH